MEYRGAEVAAGRGSAVFPLYPSTKPPSLSGLLLLAKSPRFPGGNGGLLKKHLADEEGCADQLPLQPNQRPLTLWSS